ncbi:15735_t:CDS:2 [Cetraspora pellucida]|uniref:15735_t:CDS:1 n=1 Tax=Cetraspora pellucida TaxID=1433469 RepID=A0A9N8W4M6_9GLOM|nr:15735_t:CDS:2 [Cetraspora pellucida]
MGSLEKSDITKISIIQNWIARYIMQHKQKTELKSDISLIKSS